MLRDRHTARSCRAKGSVETLSRGSHQLLERLVEQAPLEGRPLSSQLQLVPNLPPSAQRLHSAPKRCELRVDLCERSLAGGPGLGSPVAAADGTVERGRSARLRRGERPAPRSCG